MAELQKPVSLEAHQHKYNEGAWKQYEVHELGWWVHLFLKRATHRSDPLKKQKDLEDAQNYLNMMQAHVDAARIDAAKVELQEG